MGLEVNLGQRARHAARRAPDAPLRMLVCADLSGASDARAVAALRERRTSRIDVDSFEQVLARIAPRVELALDSGRTLVEFASIDDFHPDRLIRRLAAFATLRGLREELDNPATFERAAAALGAGAPTPDATGDAASDVERLLGPRPAALSPSPAPAGAGSLQAWIRDLVGPHIVPDTGSRKQMLLASLDGAIAQQMRQVLRCPALRQLESSWRGVEWLVREFGGEASIEIHLLDASRAELLEDVRGSAADLSQSALWHHLCGPLAEGPDGEVWSILVLEHAFGDDAGDVALLAGLGGIVASAGATLLAGADARVLGCADPSALGDPGAWSAPDAGAAARWAAIRGIEAAAWIGLAAPRVLMRRPYGANSDPVEAFAFEEVTDPGDPDSYLWGSPAWALALLATSAFRDHGWNADLDTSLDLADLPAYSYREDGEPKLRVCTQALVTEHAGERILAHGVMPLIGRRDRAALRLMRWQSLATPPKRLHGPWT